MGYWITGEVTGEACAKVSFNFSWSFSSELKNELEYMTYQDDEELGMYLLECMDLDLYGKEIDEIKLDKIELKDQDEPELTCLIEMKIKFDFIIDKYYDKLSCWELGLVKALEKQKPLSKINLPSDVQVEDMRIKSATWDGIGEDNEEVNIEAEGQY